MKMVSMIQRTVSKALREITKMDLLLPVLLTTYWRTTGYLMECRCSTRKKRIYKSKKGLLALVGITQTMLR